MVEHTKTHRTGRGEGRGDAFARRGSSEEVAGTSFGSFGLCRVFARRRMFTRFSSWPLTKLLFENVQQVCFIL